MSGMIDEVQALVYKIMEEHPEPRVQVLCKGILSLCEILKT